MRGEELQGLSIEELQQLEKALEAGLTRVIETKVVLTYDLLMLKVVNRMIQCISFSKLTNARCCLQSEKIMSEISDLQRKVKYRKEVYYLLIQMILAILRVQISLFGV